MACSSSESADGESPVANETSQLEIYVYTPEKPVVTRAEVEKIDPEKMEKTIKTLQIWVFVAEEKTSVIVCPSERPCTVETTARA